MEKIYSKVDYKGLTAINMFENLKYRINSNVVIEYVHNGTKGKITEELKSVVNFNKITTLTKEIPFFDDNFAIIKITATQSGETLYINKILDYTKNTIDQTIIDFSRKKVYGDKIADKQLARKRKQQEKELSTKDKDDFVKQIVISSKDYIDETKLDDWITFIYKNVEDYNSLHVLNVLIDNLKKISLSENLDNVDNFLLLDGNEASFITCAIINFSNKGIEYLNNKLKIEEKEEQNKRAIK